MSPVLTATKVHTPSAEELIRTADAVFEVYNNRDRREPSKLDKISGAVARVFDRN